MSATNKELRAGFMQGASWAYRWYCEHPGKHPMFTDREAAALEHYPKPKVTRPKTIEVGKFTYWFEDGMLYAAVKDGGEAQAARVSADVNATFWWTVEDVKRLAELAANPTEDVEDESS